MGPAVARPGHLVEPVVDRIVDTSHNKLGIHHKQRTDLERYNTGHTAHYNRPGYQRQAHQVVRPSQEEIERLQQLEVQAVDRHIHRSQCQKHCSFGDRLVDTRQRDRPCFVVEGFL